MTQGGCLCRALADISCIEDDAGFSLTVTCAGTNDFHNTPGTVTMAKAKLSCAGSPEILQCRHKGCPSSWLIICVHVGENFRVHPLRGCITQHTLRRGTGI